jgi:hypothetical protein
MTAIPQELDWVKVRSACSVAQVFSELYLGAESDVKAMNLTPSATPEHLGSPFAVHSNSTGNVFVVFQTGNTNRTVKFTLGPDRIAVTNQNGQFTVTLTLNNEGRCKLRMNGGEELEQWQVRRMMLEGLFFGD